MRCRQTIRQQKSAWTWKKIIWQSCQRLCRVKFTILGIFSINYNSRGTCYWFVQLFVILTKRPLFDIINYLNFLARVAELVDALGSGPSVLTVIGVQVSSRVLKRNFSCRKQKVFCFFFVFRF